MPAKTTGGSYEFWVEGIEAMFDRPCEEFLTCTQDKTG